MRAARLPGPARLSARAALAHRLSGLALALFLPIHFLALGLALEGAAALDAMLAVAEMAAFKLAEWGLVILLALHLGLGLRVLAIELGPWREAAGLRPGWIWAGIGASAAAGLLFLAGAF